MLKSDIRISSPSGVARWALTAILTAPDGSGKGRDLGVGRALGGPEFGSDRGEGTTIGGAIGGVSFPGWVEFPSQSD
jgi:hypothetical protein